MTLSLGTAYRSFGGEVEASSTPTICRLPDSRRHQLWAIARMDMKLPLATRFQLQSSPSTKPRPVWPLFANKSQLCSQRKSPRAYCGTEGCTEVLMLRTL